MALVPDLDYNLECEQREGSGKLTISTEGAVIELHWSDTDAAAELLAKFPGILLDTAEEFRRGEVEPKKPDDWSTEELF
jgi:hypothetical protein